MWMSDLFFFFAWFQHSWRSSNQNFSRSKRNALVCLNRQFLNKHLRPLRGTIITSITWRPWRCCRTKEPALPRLYAQKLASALIERRSKVVIELERLPCDCSPMRCLNWPFRAEKKGFSAGVYFDLLNQVSHRWARQQRPSKFVRRGVFKEHRALSSLYKVYVGALSGPPD